jgi:hypothetical protein
MPAPCKEKRVSFESSNIRGVRVLGIHADGAIVVSKTQSTSYKP